MFGDKICFPFFHKYKEYPIVFPGGLYVDGTPRKPVKTYRYICEKCGLDKYWNVFVDIKEHDGTRD